MTTSSTASYVSTRTGGEFQGTASGYGGAPATTALLVGLLAFQSAGVAFLVSHKPEAAAATRLAASITQDNLLRELIDFHVRLAASQKDLPEDAARVLRDKLWDLYE